MNRKTRKNPSGARRFPAILRAGVVVLAVGCGRPATNTPPTAPRITVDGVPEPMYIGDLADVRFRVLHPEGAKVRFPEPDPDPSLEMGRWTAPETQPAPWPGWQTTSRGATELHSFSVGEYRLFPDGAVVHITAEDGAETALAMPTVPIRVISVLNPEGTDELPDFKPPLDWPTRFPPWGWALPLVAVLAALAGRMAHRAMRRRRTRPTPSPAPPHQIALVALQRIREDGTMEHGPADPFYRELSAIVRRYLEDRFALRAPERTTEECIREAAESGKLEPGQRERIHAFLRECDLVKFARVEAEPAGRKAAWQAAEKLVLETAVDVQHRRAPEPPCPPRCGSDGVKPGEGTP